MRALGSTRSIRALRSEASARHIITLLAAIGSDLATSICASTTQGNPSTEITTVSNVTRLMGYYCRCVL